MSESAISHQLRLLKQSRIVIGHKKGKHVYYELADYHIYKIIKGTQEHLNE
jgi:DNA-binding transcriptional ArsR family regulator